MDADGLLCACGPRNLSDNALAEAKVDAREWSRRRSTAVIAARRVTVVPLALKAVAVYTERNVCVEKAKKGKSSRDRRAGKEERRRPGRYPNQRGWGRVGVGEARSSKSSIPSVLFPGLISSSLAFSHAHKPSPRHQELLSSQTVGPLGVRLNGLRIQAIRPVTRRKGS